MSRAIIPVPGLFWGHYPQKKNIPPTFSQRCQAWLAHRLDELQTRWGWWQARADKAFLDEVHGAHKALEEASSTALFDALTQARLVLVTDGLTPATLAQAFAVVGVTAQRCLGLAPFDTQLLAAQTVLMQKLAEMATGEGKSFTVALAAATAALSGAPVHVITANDYLVERDADHFQPLFAALGLTIGTVIQTDSPGLRQSAYACNITYVTAKELVFDYLRDGVDERAGTDAAVNRVGRRGKLSGPPKLLRGLCMAIIDEADAILIDEARMPLILAKGQDPLEADKSREQALQALALARGLAQPLHYTVDPATRQATLTTVGEAQLDLACASLPAMWRHRVYREQAVGTALAALHLFQRDRHYLVREGKVEIIDETTGRVAPGRAWSNGLHQMVEAKEGCDLSAQQTTLAQLTYQRFFTRYFCVGGLSGTVSDARTELRALYGLSVRRIALRRPCQRMVAPPKLWSNHTAMWEAVGQRVALVHATGQPVLLATDSVAEAQTLSQRLLARGLPHAVLHAHNDHHEAAIVAQAGQKGAITVTTNIAGRGTDIALGEGVAALGGLHLISCQLNHARRIDRQLHGRTARQGDPGSVEVNWSADTALMAHFWPAWVRRRLARWAPRLPACFVKLLARCPQALAEHTQKAQRQRLAERDERQESRLSFAGRGE